jgi:putative peptidoglycan lipid II flippase
VDSKIAAGKSTNVLKAAGAMGLATFFSRILGLVREEVFAVMFGASDATDAFNVAFRIPNLFRDLFAEGAMSSALIPTFTRTYKENGELRAWRLAGLVFRILFILGCLIAAVGMIFAPQLVNLYASGFHSVPGKFELTVSLTRVMYPFFPLVALAAAFMGILNACGKFFLPAFASALFNLTSIVTGVLLALFFSHFGYEPILGMGIGVLFGGFVQAFCQLPALYKVNYRWDSENISGVRWYKEPGLKRMLFLMIPGTIGLGATQVNVLINTMLASSQGTGAVSYLNYAFRLMQFPIGLFGVSLAAATLPRISHQWVENDLDGIEKTLVSSLRHVFAINLIATVGLAFLGAPIIQLLFQYGRFNWTDTQATAAVLAAYSIGLVGYSTVKVLVPACYALGETKVPVISSVLSVALTIVFNLLMIHSLGYLGLAVGTSLAAIFNAVFLLVAIRYFLRRKGGKLSLSLLVQPFIFYFFCALVAGYASYLTDQYFLKDLFIAWKVPNIGPLGTVLLRGVHLLLLGTELLLIALFLGRALKLPEIDSLFKFLKRKLYPFAAKVD